MGPTEPIEIFIRHLDYSVTEDELKLALSDLGRISRCHIGRDENGKSRGFGIVRMMPNVDEADVIAKAYGREFNGRGIDVERARPRQEADPWARKYG